MVFDSLLAVCKNAIAAVAAAPADLQARLSFQQKSHGDLAMWMFFSPLYTWVKKGLQQTSTTTSSSILYCSHHFIPYRKLPRSSDNLEAFVLTWPNSPPDCLLYLTTG